MTILYHDLAVYFELHFTNKKSYFQGKNQVKEIEGNDREGALCLKSAWPGMARTIYGDHQRFIDTYFKEYPGETRPQTFFGGKRDG